ncbi:hypothetical protein HNR60_000003 [Rhodopseudomonas rhenobacensis]|uniref:DUF2865 domain-containing protein n=1 Tax=Rhodopseudomonas rhenobacensis TaxID=87461 RepID=A0A7W8DWM8_9BRAD|nr:DUF2865 domain-containing protein [Rhodopseudomonas rhenobacensis]MBB5045274.1 hypothetical protein [Rhodopseudomonas rhenobacensis]
MRQQFEFARARRGATLALALAVALAPQFAAAENFFEALFGGLQPKPQQRGAPTPSNFFADPFGLNQQAAPPPPRPVTASGSGPAFCVRSCDGRYFPLTARGGATPAQMCQAFCPASPTKVYFGSNIDGATAGNGERYADSDNAFAYRKALKPDCTCNGRDPAGLAPVDLTLDTSLRSGDIIATTNGLVAYSGVRVGANQTAEFTPVNSYPGLTAEVRARLGEMKVAPVSADMLTETAPLADVALPPEPAKPAPAKGKRAEAR